MVRILVVTGASGTGKTAAVEYLETRGRHGVTCHYLDSAGVPTAEVMRREFASPEEWQERATRWWIERLSKADDPEVVRVLDAQVRPSFVLAAVAESPRPPRIRIIVLECSAAVRRRRLAQRGHLDLADERMEDWAAYLRAEAAERGVTVIDTSDLTVEAVADELEAVISELRAT